MVGRVDKLKVQQAIDHWKARGLDLTPLLKAPDVPEGIARYCVQKQDHGCAGRRWSAGKRSRWICRSTM
jgi:glutamate synthase (NADPH/NADH) large chain/glutamate synthase (ferredoxin)